MIKNLRKNLKIILDIESILMYNNYCRWEKGDKICASGSVGRAQPCQGWGRGFESRLALG